jgi:hypothetical protein
MSSTLRVLKPRKLYKITEFMENWFHSLDRKAQYSTYDNGIVNFNARGGRKYQHSTALEYVTAYELI